MPVQPGTETPPVAFGDPPSGSTAQGHPDPAHALPAPTTSNLRILWIAALVVLVLLVPAIVSGVVSRAAAKHHLETETRKNEVLPVNVTLPSTNGVTSEVALPGNTTGVQRHTHLCAHQWLPEKLLTWTSART